MPAMDVFLKLNGIKGEVRDAANADAIEVVSWSWGIAQPLAPQGSAASASRPGFNDLKFIHAFDRASPLLMKACALGTRIADATITTRKDGLAPGTSQQPYPDYLIIKLTDI